MGHGLRTLIAICCFFSPLLPTTITRAEVTSYEASSLLAGHGIHYDKYGLIVHLKEDGTPDGGDTAQREGWYWLGVWLRQNTADVTPWEPKRLLTFEQVLDLLEPDHDGVLYRHPKQEPYNDPYSKEWGFSRDQLIPMIAAMGVWGKHDVIRRVWDALPESQLGKHAFNGNYRTVLGQDGINCMSLKKGDCSSKKDCSLQVDDRVCSLHVDNRDCSLKVDDRDCSLQVDTTNCKKKVFGVEVPDPACEISKGLQNDVYRANKLACEAAKSSQNGMYAGEKASCEAAKSSQNALYTAEKGKCEVEKATQNSVYSADKATCETMKSSTRLNCEVEKQTAFQICRVNEVYSGDIIGPQGINLFRRALNEDPKTPNTSLGGINIIELVNKGGAAGDTELLVNARLRVSQVQNNMDDVGDDLNHIVMLLMAKIRYPSDLSDEAARVYTHERAYSYGSYFGQYYKEYGDDMSDLTGRMKRGISKGWIADATPAYGAVRWYHRPNVGANPQLATMYQPLIDKILSGH